MSSTSGASVSTAIASSVDILEQILIRTRADVAASDTPAARLALSKRIAACYPSAPLNLSIVVSSAVGLLVAAEFKRASPSKGPLAPADASAADAVHTYASGGAAVISVLTEPHWFAGCLADLEAARTAADAVAAEGGGPLPPPRGAAILRKDFIISDFQLAEARAWGADTALLIVAALPTIGELSPLIAAARALGMEPLVEVVSEAELDVAIQAGAQVIGVNNRNLRTFVVDMGTTARVVKAAAGLLKAGRAPEGLAVISLSGLRSAADVTDLVAAARTEAGAADADAVLRGFLVGEALMRGGKGLVAELIAAGLKTRKLTATIMTVETPLKLSGRVGAQGSSLFVKMCGLRDTAAALVAARAGADALGIILVEGSPRYITPAAARDIVDAVRAYREQKPDLLRQGITSNLVDSARALRSAATRARPLVVGVFKDALRQRVREDAEAALLDVVQLHGSETASDWSGFSFPLIKVLHVAPGGEASCGPTLAAVVEEWHGVAAAFLLDSLGGGTGVAFDANKALDSLETAIRGGGSVGLGLGFGALPLLLAGGLKPDSVGPALKALHVTSCAPTHTNTTFASVWGVDVSSGVEQDAPAPKGEKDALKISTFVVNARGA